MASVQPHEETLDQSWRTIVQVLPIPRQVSEVVKDSLVGPSLAGGEYLPQRLCFNGKDFFLLAEDAVQCPVLRTCAEVF